MKNGILPVLRAIPWDIVLTFLVARVSAFLERSESITRNGTPVHLHAFPFLMASPQNPHFFKPAGINSFSSQACLTSAFIYRLVGVSWCEVMSVSLPALDVCITDLKGHIITELLGIACLIVKLIVALDVTYNKWRSWQGSGANLARQARDMKPVALPQ